MVISQDEATRALREIDDARSRSTTLQVYRHFGPQMILWGCIWLLANALCDLYPQRSGTIWPVLSIVGGLGSALLGRANPRRGGTPAAGWRWALTGAVLFGFFCALFALVPAGDALRGTGAVSLFFMLAYMLFGIWAGFRVFAIGLITSAAILVDCFLFTSHQFLWLGVCAGGALIVGGLWVRHA